MMKVKENYQGMILSLFLVITATADFTNANEVSLINQNLFKKVSVSQEALHRGDLGTKHHLRSPINKYRLCLKN